MTPKLSLCLNVLAAGVLLYVQAKTSSPVAGVFANPEDERIVLSEGRISIEEGEAKRLIEPGGHAYLRYRK